MNKGIILPLLTKKKLNVLITGGRVAIFESRIQLCTLLFSENFMNKDENDCEYFLLLYEALILLSSSYTCRAKREC